MLVNEAAMPEESINYPLEIELVHDFSNYFNDNRNIKDGKYRKLETYSSGKISFDDPDNMVSITSNERQYDSHQFFWEIHSSIIRTKSYVNLGNKSEPD